jgi:hypothetical protein
LSAYQIVCVALGQRVPTSALLQQAPFFTQCSQRAIARFMAEVDTTGELWDRGFDVTCLINTSPDSRPGLRHAVGGKREKFLDRV